MKRMVMLLSLGLGILMVTGCSEAKRKAAETLRGAEEHALSKGFGDVQDKADSAINKGEATATGQDKDAKDRNALNGNDDSSDKDK